MGRVSTRLDPENNVGGHCGPLVSQRATRATSKDLCGRFAGAVLAHAARHIRSPHWALDHRNRRYRGNGRPALGPCRDAGPTFS